jgi:type IV secretory pathway VirB2 component (pilin)
MPDMAFSKSMADPTALPTALVRAVTPMKNWSWNWALVWGIVIALGAAALYISVQRPVFFP